jgi:hypothetical protein
VNSSPAILAAAIVTILTFTFLWKSNPAYRLMEHVLLAISAGHALTMGYNNLRTIAWIPITQKGQYSLLIPLILGALLYARYVKSIAWVSRIPLAVMIGTASALALRGSIQSQLLQQIAATASLKNLDSVLVFIGVIVTISYFTFTYKLQGPAEAIPRLGRWVMMIGFGAAFGGAVMGRLSLVVGRFQFLFGDWLGWMK